jgi:hypothetical protein
MSDDNVVVLDVLTTINLPPERILNAALEADLAALVIVGYDKNGEYYFHSSIPHGATINWLLDQCKKRIIDEPSDMRGEPGTEDWYAHHDMTKGRTTCPTCLGTGEKP